MYGWRAKIGLMIPSSNTVVEQEFTRITRDVEGVIGCAARLLIESTDAAGLVRMNEHIELAARELTTLKPDGIIYGCTSGGFVDGERGDESLRRRIATIAGCPTVTISEAIVSAFHTVRATRVAMLTPYNEDVTRREVDFLRGAGIEVVDYLYRDIEDNLERGAQSPETTFFHARRLDCSRAEAVFLSCSNVRTVEIIEALEAHSGLPVIASSPAVTWLALRRAGIREPLAGLGSLLRLQPVDLE